MRVTDLDDRFDYVDASSEEEMSALVAACAEDAFVGAILSLSGGLGTGFGYFTLDCPTRELLRDYFEADGALLYDRAYSTGGADGHVYAFAIAEAPDPCEYMLVIWRSVEPVEE